MKPDGKARNVDSLRSLVKGFRFYSECIRKPSKVLRRGFIEWILSSCYVPGTI